MEASDALRCILLCVLSLATAPTSAAITRDLSHQYWDGVGVYIAVDREKVKERLCEYHTNNPGAHHLYIPDSPVVQGINASQHVIYVDFGFTTTRDSGGNTTTDANSAVIIPFLSTSPGGRPKYHLLLDTLYPAARGDVYDPNLLSPHRALDSLEVTKRGVILRNREGLVDCDEMMVVAYGLPEPCEPPPPFMKEEFAQVTNISVISASALDFGFCDRPTDSAASIQVCERFAGIRAEIEDCLPNVCSFISSDYESACRAPVSVFAATSGFRRMLLLGDDDPVNIVATERTFGNYTQYLKYPCIVEDA